MAYAAWAARARSGYGHERGSGAGRWLAALVVLLLLVLVAQSARANPAFARQYGMSCAACHAAFPRLNSFGEQFLADNIRLPNWREAVGIDTGDDRLVLPKMPQFAVRAQAYAQFREAEARDASGATTADSVSDIQAPYLIKLLSGAPLSDHISYYFYAIFAEKGGNGETIVEDAWFNHDDLFGTGIDMMIGQFQLSDFMFARETRMTVQDFIPYRMAGITYERGISLSNDYGPLSVTVGVANGNGIEANAKLNSAGFGRPDHAFDNDNSKSLFAHLGMEAGPVTVGLFTLDGEQRNNAGSADVGKQVIGVDLSGSSEERLFWFVQLLAVEWDDFLAAGETARWQAAFAGVDYVLDDYWAFSLLYNYGDAGDLAGSGTVYEGIDLSSLTFTASYYFMRNIKGIAELNVDLLEVDANPADGRGHDTKEGYVLFGFDAAF